MQYEGSIYRPPLEADSLLIQVTIGCAWNECKFCTMYKDKKFRVRPMEDIRRDLAECSVYGHHYQRIFLCDGDAFVLSADKLLEILGMIRQYFPHIEAVRCYGSARDVLTKTPEELKEIRAMGLDNVVMGLESGNDQLLAASNKGATKADMIKAGQMLREAGISQAVSVIAGYGGDEMWREHILDTAEALNGMQPQRLSLLVLSPNPEYGAAAHKDYEWIYAPSPLQVVKEMKLLVENLELEDCFFNSIHVSNYINIRANLPRDKDEIIEVLDEVLASAEAGPGTAGRIIPS